MSRESNNRLVSASAAVLVLLFCVPYATAAPAHDQCTNAIPVTMGTQYSGSNTGATGSITSSCSTGDTNDVWHSFAPATSGLYKISLCGSSFDTTMVLYDGCGGTAIACNDDGNCIEYESEITKILTGGQTYLLRIAGYYNEEGNYNILITTEACNPPAAAAAPNPPDGGKDTPGNTMLSWNGSTPPPKSKSNPDTTKEDIVNIKLIYGDDDRMDQYQVFDADLLDAGNSTVAILDMWDVVNNGDGTVSLPTLSFADSFGVCPEEPYSDQPNPAWCSGFLVAPDIVATAGHCITDDFDCASTAFVFGFVMENATTPRVTIDESQVYYCAGIIARSEGSSDWGLIQLDRPVTDHAPLKVSDQPVADAEDLIVIGHPAGLPRKYAGGAEVKDNTPATYFQANLDTYGGNSGSAVFNANTLEVVGILVNGNIDFVTVGGCEVSNQCPDGGCTDPEAYSLWEGVTRATEFTDIIPSWDVYIQPAGGTETLLCNTTTQWCDPGTLQCGMTYNWRVVSNNMCGATDGTKWSFWVEPTGDFNNNCTVDINDFVTLGERWKNTGCTDNNSWCSGTDLDQSGDVNIGDLQLWVLNWMDSIP